MFWFKRVNTLGGYDGTGWAYARATPSMTVNKVTIFALLNRAPRIDIERSVMNIGVAARTT